jgi:hypothetical protein
VVSAAINISATTNQYSVAHVSEIVYPLSTWRCQKGGKLTIGFSKEDLSLTALSLMISDWTHCGSEAKMFVLNSPPDVFRLGAASIHWIINRSDSLINFLHATTNKWFRVLLVVIPNWCFLLRCSSWLLKTHKFEFFWLRIHPKF